MATVVETPPRAWGRLFHCYFRYPPFGNTPTSVGKTVVHYEEWVPGGKHPHERGEDWPIGEASPV